MKAMELSEFTDMIKKDVRRGDLVALHTQHSDCVGFFEGVYPKANVPFIVLAATRKIAQGKDNEDWYDHTYSVPLERIKTIKKIG